MVTIILTKAFYSAFSLVLSLIRLVLSTTQSVFVRNTYVFLYSYTEGYVHIYIYNFTHSYKVVYLIRLHM